MNVVLVVLHGVVIRFAGSTDTRPIVMKLFTHKKCHINDNILHQATEADF